MAVAEIVTIGTELLLGEIHDTNSRYIARVLRDIGVDLYRLTTVGDNVQRITATLQEALMRADIVITTGGLGPTVDDPTRQAVAKVFNVPLVYHEELWQQIQEYFNRYNRVPTENNKRQAYIPANGIPIKNDVGTAPAFVYELGTKTVISLPGVPREMEYLMQNFARGYLKQRYGLKETVIRPWVIHTIFKGESSIDEMIGDLEKLSNPTVGLLAHPGQTDIRVTAKADSVAEAEKMMDPVIAIIREKLGNYIYGENETSLEEAVAGIIDENDAKLTLIEVGTRGEISTRLKKHTPDRVSGEYIDGKISVETLKALMADAHNQQNSTLSLGVMLASEGDRQDLTLILQAKGAEKIQQRSYGGPPEDGQIWAVNSALDAIRRNFLNY